MIWGLTRAMWVEPGLGCLLVRRRGRPCSVSRAAALLRRSALCAHGPGCAPALSSRPHIRPGTWAGLLSPSDYVRVTSAAAAQAFNIYPQKVWAGAAALACYVFQR